MKACVIGTVMGVILFGLFLPIWTILIGAPVGFLVGGLVYNLGVPMAFIWGEEKGYNFGQTRPGVYQPTLFERIKEAMFPHNPDAVAGPKLQAYWNDPATAARVKQIWG